MSSYDEPAVKTQHAPRHEVCIIACHEKHGYLLLLNCRTEGKEFRLPSRKFEPPQNGDDYYKEARVQASREMRKTTGLSVAPGRFNRIYFPAQVQKRLGNKVFLQVPLFDYDSLTLGETAMTGEQDFGSSWSRLMDSPSIGIFATQLLPYEAPAEPWHMPCWQQRPSTVRPAASAASSRR